MAGGDQGGVRVRAAAGDHREDTAVGVVADLEVVLFDEGAGAQAGVSVTVGKLYYE